jgi:hypothetical protein
VGHGIWSATDGYKACNVKRAAVGLEVTNQVSVVHLEETVQQPSFVLPAEGKVVC